MKINEVEAQVGVTKKNIRFYEEQGLLAPRRNAANGYREYSEGDVAALRRIKLMRKLGVPIAEIRQMQEGIHTVGDGMRRHLVTLEREKRNLEQAQRICEQLRENETLLGELDAESLLAEMERLEQAGATFQNKQTRDIGIRYAAPVAVAAVIVLFLASVTAVEVWAFYADPANSPPLPLALVFAAAPVVVIAGVLLALYQRIKEIMKGEFDDAKKY